MQRDWIFCHGFKKLKGNWIFLKWKQGLIHRTNVRLIHKTEGNFSAWRWQKWAWNVIQTVKSLCCILVTKLCSLCETSMSKKRRKLFCLVSKVDCVLLSIIEFIVTKIQYWKRKKEWNFAEKKTFIINNACKSQAVLSTRSIGSILLSLYTLLMF